MKKIAAVTFLFLSSHPLFAQEERLQQLAKQYGIPGIQLVCIKDGKEQRVNIGTISRESDQKVTANTIFEAASLSKCVFAYAVLRLHDRGVISLDTPLINYIGSYERFDSTDPRYAKITARTKNPLNTKAAHWAAFSIVVLRFRADSNRCKRFCRPLPSHSATKPS
jgi:CubicO group peptidase (beta-lactamase class C family)